jgi:hypothetical protein
MVKAAPSAIAEPANSEILSFVIISLLLVKRCKELVAGADAQADEISVLRLV